MPFVGWILPGDGVGVVRGDECYPSMGTTDSMDLLHDGQYRVHMLDDMGGENFIKGVVLDGIRNLVQIMDQVHLRQLDAIHAHSARTLVPATTDIEDAFFHMRADFNTLFPFSLWAKRASIKLTESWPINGCMFKGRKQLLP